ncbi:MAG TPA: 2,3-bisphosphoglycerate-independent phosphoglycerate mutase [Spirochaetia bacterium]|nr:2,3-bisphosphoglycerate-independent phosphoglycerate mutase [Spirochaetia bacterium]
MANNTVILCILDGWDIAPPGTSNVFTLAHSKVYNHLLQTSPSTQLLASGPAVGLPQGQNGNIETGYLNIGAGRIVFQDLSLINTAIADGSFFTNKALMDTVKHITSFESSLHLIGMISRSGVHAYNEHLYALLLFAKKHHLTNVYLHLLTDGRDSPPDNGLEQIRLVQEKIDQFGVGKISSIMGRYYAMDSDSKLERTQKAYDCLIGKDYPNIPTAKICLEKSYQNNLYDEFVEPATIGKNPANSRIKAGDSVIFFNFRTDCPSQLTNMFLQSGIPNLRFVTMTKYRNDFQNPYLYLATTPKNTLGEVISKNKLKQLKAAETEKIATVSYYFNGQNEITFPGESHLIVDPQKIAINNLTPRISTEKLIEEFSKKIKTDDYSLSVINIACSDIIAHTSVVDKTIEAIKVTDNALGNLVNLAKDTNSYLIITAYHGNTEEVINKKLGKIDTQSKIHVPLIIYHPHDTSFKLSPGKLGDLGPTILNLLKLPIPPEMTGNDLITRNPSI